MADTGWVYPSSATGNAGGGSADWTNPQNIYAGDANNAVCPLYGQSYSRKLRGYNYGFNIPTGDTIDGIYARIEVCGSTASAMQDSEIYLMDDTTPKGDNKSAGAAWPSGWVTKYFGGAADLWNASWTAAQINASTFGFALKTYNSWGSPQNAYVDYFSLKIYYSTPTSGVDHLMIMGM